MTNRTAAVLRQMREAIGWIDADVDGFDRSRFVADRRARQLVERNLEILSEGSRRIPRDLKATEPDVAWSALASLGNASRPPDDPRQHPRATRFISASGARATSLAADPLPPSVRWEYSIRADEKLRSWAARE